MLLVFTLLLADFFDTMGTMIAVGAEGDLLDSEGNPPKTREIPGVDSLPQLLVVWVAFPPTPLILSPPPVLVKVPVLVWPVWLPAACSSCRCSLPRW